MREIVGDVVKYCDLVAKIKIAKFFFLAYSSVRCPPKLLITLGRQQAEVWKRKASSAGYR